MASTYRQHSLFNEAAATPLLAGLSYIPDFIDTQTEATLIQMIDVQPWITELKRRVQHYGYRYDYKARNITLDSRLGEIPVWLMPYCKKLLREAHFKQLPDQVIINEYQAGQGISAHIDCVPCFGDTIASLSLGSPCLMDFTHNKTGEKAAHLLETRSLLVMSGPTRSEWQHGIAQRKTDKFNGGVITRGRRISLTFRNVMLEER